MWKWETLKEDLYIWSFRVFENRWRQSDLIYDSKCNTYGIGVCFYYLGYFGAFEQHEVEKCLNQREFE